jgi:hypothetical protein
MAEPSVTIATLQSRVLVLGDLPVVRICRNGRIVPTYALVLMQLALAMLNTSAVRV